MEIIALLIAFLVPIGVAIWTVRSSAKDTAQQIAALNDSTQKQVESIKELAKIQTKIAALQIEKEAWEARHRWRQVSEESWSSIEDDDRMAGIPYNEITEMFRHRRERGNHLLAEENFYAKQISSLDGYCTRVKEILKELDKD